VTASSSVVDACAAIIPGTQDKTSTVAIWEQFRMAALSQKGRVSTSFRRALALTFNDRFQISKI
jgi:hypothetical protein